ncbi:MAG: transcriptional regulator [Nitrosopumilaceae archaeon]
MNGLDILLAKSLGSVIKNNLGQRTLQKIEKRLFEKFGISLTQSLLEFHKLDTVLREFFGAGADGLERKFFENLVALDKGSKNQEWLIIEDQALSKIILESFGDDDKKLIMNTLLDKSLIISEVLDRCKIPQTSGYRKINSLIQNGLLTTDGFITTNDGKKVNMYTSLFENLKIDIEKNKVIVKVKLRKNALQNSSVVQVMRGL